jgi:hypothetical protein
MTSKKPIESQIELKAIEYPNPVIPNRLPELPKSEYESRLQKVRSLMKKNGFTHIVIYGDREHFANVRFLTGYDPRFEETLLIIPLDKKPILMVGNEGLGYSKIKQLDVEIEFFQHFSLQGQPRDRSRKFVDIFRDVEIDQNSLIGIVSNKYVENDELGDRRYVIDAPAYIVDLLRQLCGSTQVVDVTYWFTDSQDGLRIPLTVDEIALYEAANLLVYAGMKNALESLKPGITEIETASKLNYNGAFPLSCHISIGFGENALLGLGSPTNRKLRKGDFVTIGFGVWGANIARSGIALAGPEELPHPIGDALDKVYKPYFAGLHNWYKALKIGVTGGELFDSLGELTTAPFFGMNLNPGHQLRDEEWINTPILSGSKLKLPPQTMLQSDINVNAAVPYSGIHSEDGLVLADSKTRQQLADRYPDVWERIVRRRKMMMAELGYELHDDVLPLSDMEGIVTPFLLNSRLALCFMK